jgi:hypothetical protein
MLGRSGDPFGATMTASRHHFRLSSVVFAAILGTFSAVGEVSASALKSDGQGPGRACCLSRVCAKCCCPPVSKVSGVSPSGPSANVSTARSRLSAPAPLCECRPGGPNSPASKDEPRSSETREDQVAGHAAEPTVESVPAITLVRIDLTPPAPPKAPLYLRTSRLLI